MFDLQVRAGAEPRNLAVGDPEVVEVGPAMFSIPQVPLNSYSLARLFPQNFPFETLISLNALLMVLFFFFFSLY